MISSTFSIETFAEAVKDRDTQMVIAMAVDEATKVDRLVLNSRQPAQQQMLRTYSRQLKELINYHRYTVKPRHAEKTAYRLYMRYWGKIAELPEAYFGTPSETDEVHKTM